MRTVAVTAIVALLFTGCARNTAPPAQATASNAGTASGNVQSAQDALATLKARTPQEQHHLLELIQSALQRAATSLAEVQDGLRAAAVERDQLRTERDKAVEETDGWRRAWLGGRGHAWLNTALLIAAIGVIIRLIALFVLTTFGAVLSRVGSLLLCVSIVGAPLLLLFEEAWEWKSRKGVSSS